MLRSFGFEVVKLYVPFFPKAATTPNVYENDTISQTIPTWHDDQGFPEFLAVAGVKPYLVQSNGTNESQEATLMGPAIHVQEGDRLKVDVINSLLSSGLSIHWHGFEMLSALEYDGVIGVTQCPIEPEGGSFSYNFVVEEEPGTYWYHTHSGSLKDNLIDAIRGPLIVHPAGETSKSLVDQLNLYSSAEDNSNGLLSATPLSYGNERILFFSDGFNGNEHDALLYNMGGLNHALSKNEDGFGVGTHPWEYGTCNGKAREIITVTAGRTYKLRLLNGGSVYALRVRIDMFRLTITAADSSPVKPYVVDEVILHTAERFDIEISIPKEISPGSTFWIRADTLESRALGYDNGIRAILHVIGEGATDSNLIPGTSDPFLTDPPSKATELTSSNRVVTMNCYSRVQNRICLPITSLQQNNSKLEQHKASELPVIAKERHTVDLKFQGSPQFAHFVQIDGGLIYQNVNPKRSMISPDFYAERDLHPHSVIMDVASHSSIVIIWRTDNTMDHPVHVHGYKLEILEVSLPKRQQDCTHVKCKLNNAFSSPEKLAELESLPRNMAVVKDTFIVPAGGAVATRFVTKEAALWLVHCHMNLHREDGMAFVLNVGNFSAPKNESWLPKDYPKCDSRFMKTSTPNHPACECYDNVDSVLNMRLTEEFRCSRKHLCHHTHNEIVNLPYQKYPGKISTHAGYSIPGWGISCIVIVLILTIATLLHASKILNTWKEERHRVNKSQSAWTAKNRVPGSTVNGSTISSEDPRGNSRQTTNTNKISIEGGSQNICDEIVLEGVIQEKGDNSNLVESCENVDEPVAKDTFDSPPEQEIQYNVSFQGTRFSSAGAMDSDTEPKERKMIRPPFLQITRSHFLKQLKYFFWSDWKKTRKNCINIFRLVEVLGLAVITGVVFFDIGSNTSNRSLRESISLLFFSLTLWTFNRMYPAVVSFNQWRRRVMKDFSKDDYSLEAACIVQAVVHICSEGWWPLLYCFVCFPFAQVAGNIAVVFKTSVFLSLNLLCYISLGSLLGTIFGTVSWGMIAATLISQASILCAGFYTTLPSFISVFRYLSPVYHAFSGILKLNYHWSDSYQCLRGDAELGATQCFIEFSGSIDDLKARGINVASFNDPMSSVVWPQMLALVGLYMLPQLCMYGFLKLCKWLLSSDSNQQETQEANSGHSSSFRSSFMRNSVHSMRNYANNLAPERALERQKAMKRLSIRSMRRLSSVRSLLSSIGMCAEEESVDERSA